MFRSAVPSVFVAPLAAPPLGRLGPQRLMGGYRPGPRRRADADPLWRSGGKLADWLPPPPPAVPPSSPSCSSSLHLLLLPPLSLLHLLRSLPPSPLSLPPSSCCSASSSFSSSTSSHFVFTGMSERVAAALRADWTLSSCVSVRPPLWTAFL